MSQLGIDSHVEISCTGRDIRIREGIEGKVCTIHLFNNSMGPMENNKTVNVVISLIHKRYFIRFIKHYIL